ncbi:hypothetical protein BH24ACT26_BH24ACT26_16570 [soil metagenome]
MRYIKSQAGWLLFLTFCSYWLVVPVANAYIDPGSGSYIFQILIGLLLGAGVGLKVFWQRIRAFFSRERTGDSQPPEE